MKSFVIAACVLVLAIVQTSVVVAKELAEYRTEADQYYDDGNYKKAYKGYLKIAKIGDQYSQHWVSHMYENGEGKSVDLEDAYAWSVLAAEGGDEKLVLHSTDLFEQIEDKAGATKAASKLMAKYGKQALDDKAEYLAKRDAGRRAGSCTGSRLTCNRAYGYDAPITGGPELQHTISAGER
jgi:TPR repeat protein